MTKQERINLKGTFTLPGTSSVKHLQENLAAASLQLPPEAVAELDSIGGVVEG